MYNTLASLIHYPLTNNIEKATYDDNHPTDGTLIHEINEYLKSYPNQYTFVLDTLEKKLNSGEPNVIYKSLRLIKHLYLKAPKNYRSLFNSLHDPIRKCSEFKQKKSQNLVLFATAEDIREESNSLLRLLIGEKKSYLKENLVAPQNRIESLSSRKSSYLPSNINKIEDENELSFNIYSCLGEWMDDLIDFSHGDGNEKIEDQITRPTNPIQGLIFDYASKRTLSLIDIDNFMNQLNESNLDMSIYNNFIHILNLDKMDWKFHLNLLILIESCIKNNMKESKEYFKKNEQLIKDIGNKTTKISIKRLVDDIIRII